MALRAKKDIFCLSVIRAGAVEGKIYIGPWKSNHLSFDNCEILIFWKILCQIHDFSLGVFLS